MSTRDDDPAHERDATLSMAGRPPPLRSELSAGDRIDRYELVRRLGAGGMGVVWEAHDRELDRKVAIKVVRSVLSPDGQQRLLREAQAMAKLSHPSVVPVFDIGTTDNQLYVVMELVDGPTLGKVLREDKPGWREVLRLFLRCGSGLAAAHAAGIVHRDFKPENVLMSKDGRVQITDFGLARLGDTADGALAEGSPANDDSLTGDGAFLGTPRYMAPEQRLGEATPRSDQYAFCVALWEALYNKRPEGERPVAGAAGKQVPAAIEAIVGRGLSAKPEARWPSMTQLLDALGAVPVRRQRIVIAGAALVGVGALVVTMFFALERGHAADSCTGFDARLAGVWNPTIRDGITAAFAKVGTSRAVETGKRATGLLETRTQDWIAARTAVCRAAARKEVSPEVAEVRVDCLERRRDELASIAHLLGTVDAKTLPRAIGAADDYGRVSGCLRELDRKSDGDPLDPRLSDIRARASEGLLLRKFGRVTDAIAALPKLADEAREAGAPALAGELVLELALAEAPADPAKARAALEQATQLAGEAHDDMLIARALIQGLYQTGIVEKHVPEALAMRQSTEVAIAKAGSTSDLESGFHFNVGLLLATADRPDEAWVELQRALSTEEASAEPRVSQILTVLNSLGNTAEERGDLDAATKMFERGVTLIEQREGPGAPLVAYPTNNLGNIAMRQGKHERALELYRKANALFEANLPAGSATLAISAMNIAMELEALRRFDEALPLYQRSLAIREAALGPDNADVAQTLVNFASFQGTQGHYAEARAMLERAVAIRRKAYGPDHVLLASALANLALVEADAGDVPAGIAAATEAVAILDRTNREENARVLEPLIALGHVELVAKAPKLAIAPFERILALKPPPDPNLVARAEYELARALWESGGDRVRAVALVHKAHDALVAAGVAGEPWTGRSAAWLAEHDTAR